MLLHNYILLPSVWPNPTSSITLNILSTEGAEKVFPKTAAVNIPGPTTPGYINSFSALLPDINLTYYYNTI